jgi:2-phosphoglycerate kinase
MTNVVKTDKRTQVFEKKKIVRSIKNAGIDEITAHEIASNVPETEGITTDEIRRIVTEGALPPEWP